MQRLLSLAFPIPYDPTDKTDSVDWCNIEYPTKTLKRKFGEIP